VINSNLGRISHRFRDMVIFRWKRTFFPPPLFNPEFENISLVPDRWNFACL